ncbi:dUTPase [Deinococcus seoulensis]|uniref:dUTP diphosphatase n=1 Tax=Deinococcus seoulensis TaxID=1837379 RepID=A0ABQ2RRR2_9DEIO|nr:dUTP diphosphatase [Deinococcus seoulensis]GGR50489.1 dUTPase [Deinococcus seoulensis]
MVSTPGTLTVPVEAARAARARGFEVVAETHRVHPDAPITLPRRGSRQAAGYDFFTPVAFTVPPGGRVVIATDVKAFMGPGEVLSIYPRSSVGMRAVMITNTVGIIDADFYGNPGNDGNIRIALHNLGEEAYSAQPGDRFAQGVFSAFLLADGDDGSAPTRTGGHGHTGR